VLIALGFGSSLTAQVWDDPAIEVLGQSPLQITEQFGAPQEILVQRGSEARLDRVIYFYQSDFYYLYWWESRVWQYRFDRRHTGSIFGVQMGLTKSEVLAVLGKALRDSGLELVYQLPDQGYPVHVRLIFEQDRLVDLYVYRADF
jgi:hypothetical protein